MDSPEYGSQEWLDAIDYPDSDRAEVKRNRAKALRLVLGRPNAPESRRGYGFTIGSRGDIKRGSRYLGRRLRISLVFVPWHVEYQGRYPTCGSSIP